MLKRNTSFAVLGATALAIVIPVGLEHLAQAQPAKGAPAAFQRVREVMQNRYRDAKLTGDPDKDFAELLIGSYEDLIYLAKTQLEYGGDRQLRQTAQKISDEQQKHIDEIKQWQVRSREADYKAQPDQPPPGSGPLERRAQGQIKPAEERPKPASPMPATTSANLPTVKGTVEAVDVANGKVTLDHGAIPNLNMDGMTMPWRVQDPAVLSTLKQGDKVQFSADRVNGSPMITRITKAK